MVGHRRWSPADEGGVALIEFALVLPLILLLLFGMIDFGKAFNYWNDETHLANEAARQAAVNKNPGAPSSPSLEQWIKDRADSAELKNGGSSIDTPGVSVSFCFVDAQGPTDPSPGAPDTRVGHPVKAIVRATYRWLGYLVGQKAVVSPKQTITATSTMRIEQPYDSSSPSSNAYSQSGPVLCTP
jgi:hypothetical protein